MKKRHLAMAPYLLSSKIPYNLAMSATALVTMGGYKKALQTSWLWIGYVQEEYIYAEVHNFSY